MVKSDSDVIKEFNQLVNMSATELEKWLKSSDSTSSGWKNGDSGETVGHNSATKILDILKRNPDKKKERYTQDDIKHMRKVVSYNKRHLAQEQHFKEEKGEEELKKTKSYKSLKNDPSTTSPSTSTLEFKSDAPLPTALNLGRIGTSSTTASTLAASSTTLTSSTTTSSSASYLDTMEENVNKTIDGEMETLIASYKELVSIASIADKDKFKIAQEAFQTEARADIMVRSVQNLILLSESLKLSLLLSKTPDPILNDEALSLIESTEMEKIKVAELLADVLGLEIGFGEEIVRDLDQRYTQAQTKLGQEKGERKDAGEQQEEEMAFNARVKSKTDQDE